MNMSGPVVRRTALLIICASIVLWRSAMFAQQPQVSDMLQKYGQTSAPRDFEGTLYCIRCNLSPTPENLAPATETGMRTFY